MRTDEEALALVRSKAVALRRRRAAKVMSGGAAGLVFALVVALVLRPSDDGEVNLTSGPDRTTTTTTTTATPTTTATTAAAPDSTAVPGAGPRATASTASAPPTTTVPPFGTGGGKLLYTSPSDSMSAHLYATFGNGLENGPIPPPPGVDDVSGPQWSPDRSRLALAAGSSGIWVMAADGSASRRLTNSFDVQPQWSPDGASILVRRLSTPGQIVVVSVATGEDIAAARADGPGYWAPDSSAVVYIDRTAGPGAQDHVGNIYVLPRAGGAPAQITQDADPNAGVIYGVGPWEPNGRLTYARSAPSGTGTFTSRSDGSDVIQLSDQWAGVDWSSNDRAALVVGGSETRIVNRDGSLVATVPTGGSIRWSPDGATLAIAGHDRLTFVRADGSSISTIDGLGMQGPVWSPDGHLVAGARGTDQWGGDLIVASTDGDSAVIGRYANGMCCGIWIDW